MQDPFGVWFQELERRYLSCHSFSEVRRALQSLSSLYVQRREKLSGKHGLDTSGKRAAFGLFYGPIHYLQVREVLRALPESPTPSRRLIDLGCGTGAASAAWALERDRSLEIAGYDQSLWAVAEATWTYSFFSLRGSARRQEISKLSLAGADCAILVAFTANELTDEERKRLQRRLLQAAQRGNPILIVEPIARRVSPWLEEWAELFSPWRGKLEDWRFRVELPERLALLDRAAGLDHRQELTCRSLRVNI